MKKSDKIEDVFQEAFKEYSVKPDPTLWSKIQSNIPTAPAGSGFSAAAGNASIITKVVVGLAVISGIGISAYYLTESYPTNETSSDQSVQEEKSIPANTEEDIQNKPLSLDINVDTVEHLSNEVKEEKIKEIKQVLVEPANTNAQDQKQAIGVNEENSEVITSVRKEIEEIVDENENITNETERSNYSEIEPVQSSAQATDVNSDDEQLKNSETEDNNKGEISKSKEAGDVISSEPISEPIEEIKIDETIPNVFTPNQDGHNDVFRIITNAEDIIAMVMDKRGKVLFEWQGLYGFWDGNLPNGERAPSDVYFYQVQLIKEGKTKIKTGTVTLKR